MKLYSLEDVYLFGSNFTTVEIIEYLHQGKGIKDYGEMARVYSIDIKCLFIGVSWKKIIFV